MSQTYTIPFIRDEGGARPITLAIVRLLISGPARTAKQALEILQQAVTAWVKNTPEGKKAWTDSTGDLNIGDLALCESRFRVWAKNSSLSDPLQDFAILSIDDHDETFAYDKVLVTEKIPYQEGDEA